MKYDNENINKSMKIIIEIVQILQDRYDHEDISFTFLRLVNLGIVNIELSYNDELDKKDNKMKLEFKLFDVGKLNKIKEELLKQSRVLSLLCFCCIYL